MFWNTHSDSNNGGWQGTSVDKRARAIANRHRPCLVWFTGLSGSGKSTIAKLAEQQLYAAGIHTYLLDGDIVRQGLNKDLGFTAPDRVENIRRAGEVARLMVDAGLVVLAAFISPYAAERRFVRGLVDRDEFFEVFVDAPISELRSRDPKGLYARATRGELTNLSGIDAPYERPARPELHIDTMQVSAVDAATLVVAQLHRIRVVRSSV